MATTVPKTAVEHELGLVLTGGGARGAYQVGVLKWIARNYPNIEVPILTGVSAGAVNTAKLAASPGTFAQSCAELEVLWRSLTVEQVFRSDGLSLARSALGWGLRLISGGSRSTPRVRGFLDTQPLRELLYETLAPVNHEITGIDYNLARGRLKAVAIITTSYTTGQTVVFMKGTGIKPWERPQRRTVMTPITVDTIMASAALPIFFPAVKLGDEWYGDGGKSSRRTSRSSRSRSRRRSGDRSPASAARPAPARASSRAGHIP
jgi:NTE family protein